MASHSESEMGVNSWLEDELYQQYLHDRSTVDESWKHVFEEPRPLANGASAAPPKVAVPTPAPGPGGFKGVGEGGAIGAPPAVVNAIADALAPLGVEITRLPLTPAAIVELIERAR